MATELAASTISNDSFTSKKDKIRTTARELPTPPHEAEPIIYTIDDILIDRCQSIPNESLVGYPTSSHTAEEYTYYSAKDLDRFANGAIQVLKSQGVDRPRRQLLSGKSEVIALLGATSLDYIVTVFALTRLGYAVLFLSTRLSTEAYINLLKQTECRTILHAPLPAIEKAVSDIKSQHEGLCTDTIPPSSSYLNSTKLSELVYTGTSEAGQKTAFIIHSSGSTGLPKPIFQSHRACVSNYAVSKDFRSYFLTLPLYHNHGLSTFFRAVVKGRPISIYNASLPLTGGSLLKSLESTKPESFHCVPYALKLLAEVDGGIEALSKTKQVLFGGSSCPDELGDKLTQGGVRLLSHYGATEMGQLMTSDRPLNDTAWNYIRPLANVAPYLLFDPLEDGSFECVVLDGLPAKVTSNSDNPPNSFRTSDCFTKHPSIPNAWKYLGRIDDRVTLMNGEKVLPIPVEHRIRQNRFVKDVLVVGLGKLMPGLLVVPSEDASGLDKAQIMTAIWTDIAAANANAEAFSQISKDMVRILDVGSWYPSTDKGTMIRKACYKHFADLIDNMYAPDNGADNEDTAQNSGSKLALSVSGIEEFLLNAMKNDLGLSHVAADTDFFGAGMDSLQAIKAHGIVKRYLDIGNGTLNTNAFFDFGNVKGLAAHLYSLRIGEVVKAESEVDVMAELIEKYSDFQRPVKDEQDVVLLTGVTGSLGCYVLSKLLSKQSVRRVYCLVRASSTGAALDRVISTLSARELPLVSISKVRALPSDLSRPDLGLAPEVVEDLRNTLTKVIHSAWAVNFNIGVRSFEKQHIAGVHNLINLCLSSRRQSPAQFSFCSSISAAAGTPLPARIPEVPITELQYAQNMGYARSKLVAERIVQAAAEKTGMIARVLRVGQIVGDSVKGRWNPTEAIPLMIQSATTLKALPALNETPSWTPVDIVAQSVLELSGLEESLNDEARHFDPRTVYHVQNSKTFHWTSDLLPALRDAGLDFEIVSQREWVQRLQEGEQDPEKNPTVKLTGFFAEKYDNDLPGRKGLVFETTKTEAASPALRGGVELIKSGLIRKFVESWQREWPSACQNEKAMHIQHGA